MHDTSPSGEELCWSASAEFLTASSAQIASLLFAVVEMRIALQFLRRGYAGGVYALEPRSFAEGSLVAAPGDPNFFSPQPDRIALLRCQLAFSLGFELSVHLVSGLCGSRDWREPARF